MAFKSRHLSVSDIRRVRRAHEKLLRHVSRYGGAPASSLVSAGKAYALKQARSSLAGVALGQLAEAANPEVIRKLLMKESGLAELARYAKGGGLSRILGLFGPLGSIVGDLLSALGRKETFTLDDIEAAARLLRAAGYQVARQPIISPIPVRPGLPTKTAPGRTPPGAPPQSPAAVPSQPPLPVGSLPGQQAISMTPVHGSSNVYAYGYNADTLTLRVQFLGTAVNVHALNRTEDLRSGKGHRGAHRVRGKLGQTLTGSRRGPGPVYDYRGVPERVFRRFQSASSKGKAVWDLLRIRGTIFGHHYDYSLVAASVVDVVQPIATRRSGMLAGETVGKLTYVPRKATVTGFKPRQIKQGSQTFRSVLPRSSLQGVGRGD